MYEDQLETSPEGVATGQTKAPLNRHTPEGRRNQDLHQDEDKTTDSVTSGSDSEGGTAVNSGSDSEEDTVPFPPWKPKRNNKGNKSQPKEQACV